MFVLGRLRFACSTAALIGAASAFSLFWYMNAPIYDFLALNRIGMTPPQVLLVESEVKLSIEEEEAVVRKLDGLNVSKTVLIRDWEYYANKSTSSLMLKDGKDTEAVTPDYATALPIDALPISATQSDFGKGRLMNRPNNTVLLLEPYDDSGGIVRFFDAGNYLSLGLDCAECLLVGEKQDYTNGTPRPFLINYRENRSRLPRVSAKQVLNDWVPKEVFAGKLVVFDLSAASIKDVYRTNLFSSQKVSFSYYVASVLDSLLTSQKSFVLPVHGVVLALFFVGVLLSMFLRDISLNSALVILALTTLILVGTNAITLGVFSTFIPVVEYVLLIASYLVYAVKARNALVTNDLKSSNGTLELALAETNFHADMRDTTLCSDLHRFFSRAGEIQGLSIYEMGKSNKAECVLTLDQVELDDGSLNKIVTAIEQLPSYAERFDFIDDSGKSHRYLLVPISTSKKMVASIAMSIDGAPDSDVDKLINLSEKYHEELIAEIDSWLTSRGEATELRNINLGVITGRRRILAHRNRQYVLELMGRYKQAKSNYNRLDSAVAIYDVYGNLMSVNASAEMFAKRNDMVWYGSHLNDLLTQLTKLDSQKALKVINRTLMQGIAYRFTLHGAMNDHIGVLSHRHALAEDGESDEQIRSFLSLEIINISNIGTSARLKDSYVRDLTNQIKQDLSKLTLLVDRLSILDQDSEKYEYLSEVVEKLNDRVRKSKEFIVDLPSIEGATNYSVNLLEKLDETINGFEQALADKNIKLVYNKPSFLSHIVLDYRNLEFVFDYLFELLLDDSMVNSVLEVSIKETTSATGHSISVMVKNTGYGLPQDVLESEIDSNENHPLTQCKDFARVHGGRLELSTTAGEGIQFCLELPVNSKFH